MVHQSFSREQLFDHVSRLTHDGTVLSGAACLRMMLVQVLIGLVVMTWQACQVLTVGTTWFSASLTP